jgi:O-antigen ligase
MNPIETISFAAKNLILPISYAYWFWRYGAQSDGRAKQMSLMRTVAVYVVISTVPFQLGMIAPITEGYDMSLFEAEGAGFVGLFQTSHGAAISIATALLVIFHAIQAVKLTVSRAFLAGCALVGGYSLILTLARTGWVMLAFGLLAFAFYQRKYSEKFFGVLVLGSSLLTLLVLFNTNDMFQMRILGLNAYTVNTAVAGEEIDSGRTDFWRAALSNYITADPMTILFGYGPSEAKERMFDAVGRNIYAHNGFIDILQFYGIVGIAAFSGMFVSFVGIVRRVPPSDFLRPLSIAMLFAFVVQMMVQGERIFIADMLFTLCLAASQMRSDDRQPKLFSGYSKKTDGLRNHSKQ